MKSAYGITCTILLLLIPLHEATLSNKPHIIFILADDLGWNDVSFHGSDQIPTPNIDALAYNGVILNSHYVQPTCTPTRAALMTGRYPITMGMQGYPLVAAEPRALPPGRILPEFLRDLGYTTRAVGKWHLGYYKKDVTPTYRGFQSFLGFYTGLVSYYDYLLQEHYPDGVYSGYDLRRDLSTAWDLAGRYATDVFTDEAVRIIQSHDNSQYGPPLFLYLAHLAVHCGNRGKLLEAPQSEIDKFRHITDPNRRTYAAMVSKLDESVGRVVQALQRRDMLKHSIIVFISDNGAPTKGRFANWGSNWPFKGIKETLWEGGVRSVGLIWSPLLQQTPRVSNQLMHVTDWLPTLYTAAGGLRYNLGYEIDGKDLWNALVLNLDSPRNEILLNIDERSTTAAYRYINWKLVIGSYKRGTLDGYYGDNGEDVANPFYNVTAVTESLVGQAIIAAATTPPINVYIRPTKSYEISGLRSAAKIQCFSNNSYGIPPCNGMKPCLYDISADPCESNDLSELYPHITQQLRSLLVSQNKRLKKQTNVYPDSKAADPLRWNRTWSPWIDYCVVDPSTDAIMNVCDRRKPV